MKGRIDCKRDADASPPAKRKSPSSVHAPRSSTRMAATPPPPWRKSAGTKPLRGSVNAETPIGDGAPPTTVLSKAEPKTGVVAPIGTAAANHLAGLRRGHSRSMAASEAFLGALRSDRKHHMNVTRESVRTAQTLRLDAKVQSRDTFEAMKCFTLRFATCSSLAVLVGASLQPNPMPETREELALCIDESRQWLAHLNGLLPRTNRKAGGHPKRRSAMVSLVVGACTPVAIVCRAPLARLWTGRCVLAGLPLAVGIWPAAWLSGRLLRLCLPLSMHLS